MSAPAATLPSAHDHGHEESKFAIYVQIAMLLAVITGVEIIGVYLPFAKWFIISALIVLSVVKFLFVIFYFMHLKFDNRWFSVLFYMGLFLAVGVYIAALLTFKFFNP